MLFLEIRNISAKETPINAKPMTKKIPRVFSVVILLNTNMPPTSPKNKMPIPSITMYGSWFGSSIIIG